MSVATNRPHGFMSARTGVRSRIASKSSIDRGRPSSRAIASRGRTPFVEPPVAALGGVAVSNGGGRVLAGAAGAVLLVDVLDRHVAAAEPPGSDRAVVEAEPEHVEPGERHHGARQRLVAADGADKAVEQGPPADALDRA